MAKIKKNDEKSIKNRARVKKHRDWKKNKSIHEKFIIDQLFNGQNECITKIFDKRTDNHNDLLNEKECKIDKATEIRDKLQYWCSHHRITTTAMNDLLCILRSAGFSFLPKDRRTLMRTPINVPIQTLSNGKLWYNGVKTCLENLLIKTSHKCVTLDWNFDGLPISKSSKVQFWPVLASIRELPNVAQTFSF